MDDASARDAVRLALLEDRAREDVTTPLLGPVAARGAVARFVAEEPCVVAGVPIVEQVFRELESTIQNEPRVAEGARARPGDTLVAIRASAGTLLAGERVALNFLQRLCGIATHTRCVVDAVAGTGARITHTRKTTPGLRTLECYAVEVGGGVVNRTSLAAAVMWKDNHWTLLGKSQRGGLAVALRAAPPGLPVVVEVENETQLEAALAAGAQHILIDNQSPERLAEWARRIAPSVTIQASGGITLENARTYAAAGATLLSLGTLTHSTRATAISCEIVLP